MEEKSYDEIVEEEMESIENEIIEEEQKLEDKNYE